MKRGYINLTDIKNAPKLSDEIKPPRNAKKYMHNQSLPKQDPTKLTMMKLWDSFAQMRRYPNYFERWIMDEADLMEAELIRLGIDEGYNEDDLKEEYSGKILEATDADIITPIEKTKTKTNVKPQPQLSLFL